MLVSEDVECTSTALTYFAAALREGADLAVCDASFEMCIRDRGMAANRFFWLSITPLLRPVVPEVNMIKARAETVSYTHLDVYKRQG